MVTSGAAHLAARLTRQRALLRRVRAADVFARHSREGSDLSRALAWRRTNGTTLQRAHFSSSSTDASSGTKRPSFAIADAFNDANDQGEDGDADDQDDELSFGVELDDDKDDDALPGTAIDDDAVDGDVDATAVDLSADEAKELAQQLRFAMDRKKQWMQRLAASGAFDTLLKVVYECYEPLYTTHPVLQHTPCPLWDAYEDAVAIASAETKYHPKWYDDQVTKITEQEAMALLVSAQRPELALAIFRHREWLATEVGTVTIAHGTNVLADDVTVDFSKHFRSFYSWAMGASAALGDHAHVFTIYETALENGVFPTANMTLSYLNALIAKREFDAVAALFAQIEKDDRPTNLYFYRQMLFFAHVARDSTLMDVVLKQMKMKGFKVRSEDYLNAIRALDEEQFFQRVASQEETKHKGPAGSASSSSSLVGEGYRECVARVADQEASPDKYRQQEKACGSVIKLFEEMVEDEQIVPHSEMFFPRVLAAALFLQDYDRVVEYVALHERCFQKPLTDAAAVQVAVNALLVKDEPVAAWTLVLQAHGDKPTKEKKKQHPRERGRRERDGSVLAAVGNIVEYLTSQRETALMLQLLEALDAKKLLGPALTPPNAQLLLNALVRDTSGVPNDQLWEMVNTKYWVAFPVGSRIKMLTQLVESCMATDRWWLISKALHKRDRNEIPHLPARLALFVSTKALERTDDAECIELVAHLAKMVDIPAMSADTRLAFCCNVVRALHLLPSGSSRGLHRQREIGRIHDQFLRTKGLAIPQDVREILLNSV